MKTPNVAGRNGTMASPLKVELEFTDASLWASGRLAGCAWAATTWSVAGAGNWSRTWRRPGSAKGGGHLATERLKKKPQPIHNARHAGTEHFALSGIGTDCGMPTRWERLAGDTDVFAVKVAFMDDPDDGLGADEDQWRSWGAFQIWVRGANLCSHLEEGERVESVHWYLLPLLEWIACSWDPLLQRGTSPLQKRCGRRLAKPSGKPVSERGHR